ncbi:MAG: ATP synthase subunit C [Arhodomonas sp.]|nr:ATP synthase subunit C [Arhodomonas sp.]
MEQLILALGWAGLYGPMALGAIGSVIGCAIAGQAAIGALLETESGHGRFIGLSAMPSSQTIYGIVVMFSLQRPVTEATAPGLFAVGILAGLALLFSAIHQGSCCASAINSAKSEAGGIWALHCASGHRGGLRRFRLHLRTGHRRRHRRAADDREPANE